MPLHYLPLLQFVLLKRLLLALQPLQFILLQALGLVLLEELVIFPFPPAALILIKL